MANAVTTQVLRNDKVFYKVHLTHIGDGSGEETNVIKVDRSTLLSTAGIEPTLMSIDTVRWCIQGMTYVKLSWDHTTDDVAMLLANSGYEDFTDAYGATELDKRGIASDPNSAGGTGDLFLSTVGAGSGKTYDITILLRLSP